MCYFIHFKVMAQRKPDEAKELAAANAAAEHHGLFVYGSPPALTVANNFHCACDLVRKEHKLAASVIGFVKELLGENFVKSVEIGYQWTKPMPNDAPVERADIEDFAALSETFSLREGVWYRVNDLGKYDFSRFGRA